MSVRLGSAQRSHIRSAFSRHLFCCGSVCCELIRGCGRLKFCFSFMLEFHFFWSDEKNLCRQPDTRDWERGGAGYPSRSSRLLACRQSTRYDKSMHCKEVSKCYVQTSKSFAGIKYILQLEGGKFWVIFSVSEIFFTAMSHIDTGQDSLI